MASLKYILISLSSSKNKFKFLSKEGKFNKFCLIWSIKIMNDTFLDLSEI